MQNIIKNEIDIRQGYFQINDEILDKDLWYRIGFWKILEDDNTGEGNNVFKYQVIFKYRMIQKFCLTRTGNQTK